MVGWTAATSALRASTLTRLASSHSSFLIQRRAMAGAADHHGPPLPKVNFWQDPFTPSKWKQEQFVILSLTGCGLLMYGGYKFFAGGETDIKNKEKKAREPVH